MGRMAEVLEDRTLLSALDVVYGTGSTASSVTVTLPDYNFLSPETTTVGVAYSASSNALILTGRGFDSAPVSVSLQNSGTAIDQVNLVGQDRDDTITINSWKTGVGLSVDGGSRGVLGSDSDVLTLAASSIDFGSKDVSVMAETIAVQSNTTLTTTGELAFTATSTDVAETLGVKITSASSSISVGANASITAAKISMTADSSADTSFLEDASSVLAQATDFLGMLIGAVSMADATSTITVGSSAKLEATSGDLILAANADTEAKAKAITYYVAGAYAESVPVATISIAGGADLDSAGSMVISTDTSSKMVVQTVQGLLGPAPNSGESVNVQAALGNSEGITSTVTVADGSTLDSGGDMFLSSYWNRDHSVSAAAAAHKHGKLAIGVAVLRTPDVTVSTSVDGTLTAQDDLHVISEITTVKNDVASGAGVGMGLLAKTAAKMSLGKGPLALIKEKFSGKGTQTEDGKKKVKFAGSLSGAYLEDVSTTTVLVGPGAVLQSQSGDVVLLSRNLNKPEIKSSAGIEGGGVNGGPKVRRGAAQKCGTRVQEYPAFRRESRVSFNLWFDAA